MNDPDTTLTDFALAAESLALALLLARRRKGGNQRACRGFILLLAAAGTAALAGGLMHGFFPLGESAAARPLWRASMVAFGAMALGGWLAGAEMGLPAPWAGFVRRGSPAAFAAYTLALFLVSDAFLVGLVHYAPAAAFLLIMFLLAARSAGPAGRRVRLGAAGLAVTFAASLAQAWRLAIHPVHFDHNAVYHVLAMAGLALLYLGADAAVAAQSPRPMGEKPDVLSIAP